MNKQKNTIGIKFNNGRKIYHFNAYESDNINAGDIVIVNTANGLEAVNVVYIWDTFEPDRTMIRCKLHLPSNLEYIDKELNIYRLYDKLVYDLNHGSKLATINKLLKGIKNKIYVDTGINDSARNFYLIELQKHDDKDYEIIILNNFIVDSEDDSDLINKLSIEYQQPVFNINDIEYKECKEVSLDIEKSITYMDFKGTPARSKSYLYEALGEHLNDNQLIYLDTPINYYHVEEREDIIEQTFNEYDIYDEYNDNEVMPHALYKGHFRLFDVVDNTSTLDNDKFGIITKELIPVGYYKLMVFKYCDDLEIDYDVIRIINDNIIPRSMIKNRLDYGRVDINKDYRSIIHHNLVNRNNHHRIIAAEYTYLDDVLDRMIDGEVIPYLSTGDEDVIYTNVRLVDSNSKLVCDDIITGKLSDEVEFDYTDITNITNDDSLVNVCKTYSHKYITYDGSPHVGWISRLSDISEFINFNNIIKSNEFMYVAAGSDTMFIGEQADKNNALEKLLRKHSFDYKVNREFSREFAFIPFVTLKNVTDEDGYKSFEISNTNSCIICITEEYNRDGWDCVEKAINHIFLLNNVDEEDLELLKSYKDFNELNRHNWLYNSMGKDIDINYGKLID